MKRTGRNILFPLPPALITVATSACAQPYGRYGDQMMGPGYHGFWGMGPMSLLLWALIAIGLFLLIRWLLQMNIGQKSSTNSGQRAIEILKERYAKGEIDKTEFDRIKKDLDA